MIQLTFQMEQPNAIQDFDDLSRILLIAQYLAVLPGVPCMLLDRVAEILCADMHPTFVQLTILRHVACSAFFGNS